MWPPPGGDALGSYHREVAAGEGRALQPPSSHAQLGAWPLSKLAHVLKKTILWAMIFKTYLVSMLLQMAYIGYALYAGV